MRRFPKASDLININEEKRIFAKIFLAHYVQGFKEGVRLGSDQGSGKTKPNDVFDVKILRSLEKLSLEHAAYAAKTSEKKLKLVIGRVLKKEGSIGDLTTAINQKFTFEARWRATRVARTELTGVIGNGTMEGLSAEGFEQHKWITAIDGQQRESHAAVHGDVVDIGEDFDLEGSSAKYPGDPGLDIGERVNCRCTTISAGRRSKSVERRLASLFLRTHATLERRMISDVSREFLRQRDRIISRIASSSS